jgi:RNA-binding protein
MKPLAPTARRALRARAHHLQPVVTIGQHGLSPAVLKEIDVALTAHELIKVRVMSDDRHAREALLPRICEALECSPVQQIGKLLVLWRARKEKPRPPEEADRPKGRSARRPTPAGVLRRRAGGAPGAAMRGRRPPAADAGTATTAPRRRIGAPPSGVPRASAPRRRRGF